MNNFYKIQKEVKEIANRKVVIVAVTKNRSIDEINELIEAGVTDIGENRWQEAKNKLKNISADITKHFIGRLQTNKVRDVVAYFDMIQSVDSFKLAKKISDECAKIDKTMPILIQVNTSNEPQKGGVSPEDVEKLIEHISKLPNIQIQGLMTIGLSGDRGCFQALKQLFDTIKIPMKYLSMGMSSDYQIAIEEGANMVRIGRKLFE
ncbi:YggS family pyridoxal phosphate-dependent enzyme [Patescibacteria group bacterium]|nr:YggS family pyridoxal phosphate-dependent enzyme [Patescibacteria group bacterium]MBU1683562.1 YggS family pyridoxal phosphate-dependent enzyme [Patescibacteria group bacterium]MBU1935651.1 YggS family pyridoxal phosphate-dependent enzyme [Patescibacteria group bacterium]